MLSGQDYLAFVLFRHKVDSDEGSSQELIMTTNDGSVAAGICGLWGEGPGMLPSESKGRREVVLPPSFLELVKIWHLNMSQKNKVFMLII